MITGAGGSIGSELARQVYALPAAPAGPRRPRREPAVPDPARAGARGSSTVAARASCRVHLANVASRAVMDRLIADAKPGGHLPRRGLQARADDGGASLRRASRSTSAARWRVLDGGGRRRRRRASSSSRPTRPSSRRASWARPSASPRCSSPTPPRAPAGRTSRSGSATCSARPAASCRSSRASSRTASRSPSPIPEMTRFFMTIPEAAWLILDAAAIGRAGRPVRARHGRAGQDHRPGPRPRSACPGATPTAQPIRSSACDPARSSTRSCSTTTEQVEQTDVDKIFRVMDSRPPEDIEERADRLLQLAYGDRDEELRTASSPRSRPRCRHGSRRRTPWSVRPCR